MHNDPKDLACQWRPPAYVPDNLMPEFQRLRRIEAAARDLCTWDPCPHGDDCAHRHCEDCKDGECEETTEPCTCSRVADDALREALRGVAPVVLDPLAVLEEELQHRLVEAAEYTPAEFVDLTHAAEVLEEMRARRRREEAALEGMRAFVTACGPKLADAFASWAAPVGVDVLVEQANAVFRDLGEQGRGYVLTENDNSARVASYIELLIEQQGCARANGGGMEFDTAIDALCRLRLALREREQRGA